ncbi:hypothetical protein BDN70DRAFT_274472 [Pholiota conissans]|uniref:Uncharacterized protein n=1 Tax=Pholiota conissans TaxID=109636 RepID=A0A9P6CQI4_9AGAR|nr:hypothetical protein BDN70DRAFT_274472 [Pholiota conissans]
MLHIVPCTSFIGVFSGFLLYGVLNPWTPQRSPTGMYCHISSPGPREIAGAIAIVAMVLIIAVEALIIITLRRISGSFRSLFHNDAYIAPDGLVRVIIFSVGPFLAIVVSGAQYFDKTDAQTADLSILLALGNLYDIRDPEDMINNMSLTFNQFHLLLSLSLDLRRYCILYLCYFLNTLNVLS